MHSHSEAHLHPLRLVHLAPNHERRVMDFTLSSCICICTYNLFANDKRLLPSSVTDYLKLVDGTTDCQRQTRAYPRSLPADLKRLGVSREAWCDLAEALVVENLDRLFGRVAGRMSSLEESVTSIEPRTSSGLRKRHGKEEAPSAVRRSANRLAEPRSSSSPSLAKLTWGRRLSVSFLTVQCCVLQRANSHTLRPDMFAHVPSAGWPSLP